MKPVNKKLTDDIFKLIQQIYKGENKTIDVYRRAGRFVELGDTDQDLVAISNASYYLISLYNELFLFEEGDEVQAWGEIINRSCSCIHDGFILTIKDGIYQLDDENWYKEDELTFTEKPSEIYLGRKY